MASSPWAQNQGANMTNRWEFLQASAAIAGASIVPHSLFASPTPNFFGHAA
ncbi:MAG: hypothetical protein ACK5YR_05085 [Pirellula sp.]